MQIVFPRPPESREHYLQSVKRTTVSTQPSQLQEGYSQVPQPDAHAHEEASEQSSPTADSEDEPEAGVRRSRSANPKQEPPPPESRGHYLQSVNASVSSIQPSRLQRVAPDSRAVRLRSQVVRQPANAVGVYNNDPAASSSSRRSKNEAGRGCKNDAHADASEEWSSTADSEDDGPWGRSNPPRNTASPCVVEVEGFAENDEEDEEDSQGWSGDSDGDGPWGRIPSRNSGPLPRNIAPPPRNAAPLSSPPQNTAPPPRNMAPTRLRATRENSLRPREVEHQPDESASSGPTPGVEVGGSSAGSKDSGEKKNASAQTPPRTIVPIENHSQQRSAEESGRGRHVENDDSSGMESGREERPREIASEHPGRWLLAGPRSGVVEVVSLRPAGGEEDVVVVSAETRPCRKTSREDEDEEVGHMMKGAEDEDEDEEGSGEEWSTDSEAEESEPFRFAPYTRTFDNRFFSLSMFTCRPRPLSPLLSPQHEPLEVFTPGSRDFLIPNLDLGDTFNKVFFPGITQQASLFLPWYGTGGGLHRAPEQLQLGSSSKEDGGGAAAANNVHLRYCDSGASFRVAVETAKREQRDGDGPKTAAYAGPLLLSVTVHRKSAVQGGGRFLEVLEECADSESLLAFICLHIGTSLILLDVEAIDHLADLAGRRSEKAVCRGILRKLLVEEDCVVLTYKFDPCQWKLLYGFLNADNAEDASMNVHRFVDLKRAYGALLVREACGSIDTALIEDLPTLEVLTDEYLGATLPSEHIINAVHHRRWVIVDLDRTNGAVASGEGSGVVRRGEYLHGSREVSDFCGRNLLRATYVVFVWRRGPVSHSHDQHTCEWTR